MEEARSDAPGRLVVLGVFAAALSVRFAHNGFIMQSPLYDVPLGGHVFDLQLGERIAGGDWLPFDGPITLNSPLYPYFVSLFFRIVPAAPLLAVRLTGILVDSLTCVLVTLLAHRNFGSRAGVLAGVTATLYAPLVFYAAEPMPVALTVTLVTGAVVLLDRGGGWGRHLLAGILAGAAAGTRPDVLLLALLLAAGPLVLRRARWPVLCAAFAIGLLAAIAPVTLVNYLASGRFVLLSASGGHNFYIGHRPGAGAGYTLPDAMDGDIFASMKKAAEEAERRPFADEELSGYYVRKALFSIAADPGAELARCAAKLAAALNDFEASTYVNYYFARLLSPVLRAGPSFGWIVPFGALGALLFARRYFLIAPVVGTLLTLLLFFYIARLRMPMTPFMIVLASGACLKLATWLRDRRWMQLALAAVFLSAMAFVGNRATARIDVSNEWNKIGIVLRLRGEFEAAERAFFSARDQNPVAPESYLNLAVLYDKIGRVEDANRMRDIASRLADPRERQRFLADLRGDE